MVHLQSRSALLFGLIVSCIPFALAVEEPWVQLAQNASSSFDITENWNACFNSSIIDVVYDPSIADYTSVLNDHLKSFSETGGAVRLSPGNYPLFGPLDLPSRTCLVGDSMYNTTLQVADYSNFVGKGVVISTKGERVSLVRLKLNGTVSGTTAEMIRAETGGLSGVYFERVNYAWARNVHSTGFSKHGFDVHGSDGNVASHVFYEGCVADFNLWAGFKVALTEYASVFKSKANRNGITGVAVTGGAKETLVKGNWLHNNGGAGRGSGVMLQSEDGFSPKHVTITENMIENSTYAGIWADNATELFDYRNNITNVHHYGANCYALENTRGFLSHGTKCNITSALPFHPINDALPALSPLAASGNTCPRSFMGVYGCPFGIATGDVCCPSKCSACNKACDQNEPECCGEVIKADPQYCSQSGPPCVL